MHKPELNSVEYLSVNLFMFFLFCDRRVFEHTSRFMLCADVPSIYPTTLSAHLCWQETWLGVWCIHPYTHRT